jgi:transcriptional regulator with XRE-family HTH domain
MNEIAHGEDYMITGRQIRAARGLLGWDATVLAEKAGLSRETISNIETSAVQARESTLGDIAKVFNKHGVEFTENQGVRFKANNIEVFEGTDRFDEFYEFIYEYLKRYGGDVCIGSSDARLYAKYRKNPQLHRERMKDLVARGNVTFRILAAEGDHHLTAASYAQYRWQPKENFAPTSFYAFGDCLALVSFVHEPAPYVVLIKSGPFAEAYRQAFNIAWEKAIEPPPSALEGRS